MHECTKKGWATHWGKRVAARGSAPEYDVGIIILVNAEEALQCRFVPETARELEATCGLAAAMILYNKDLRDKQILDSEWLDVLPAGNQG